MYQSIQDLNDLYRNCNEIKYSLERICLAQQQSEILFHTAKANESLDKVRQLAEQVGLQIAEKADQVYALQHGIKQLELEFDD